ncbi:helix-turn-helix domain-containing protein [Streptomyces sp. NPDC057242]|uniref:helix-turn-helix domain-containing protein n=1 Tax=unclassified Streptomyces TaxID=2593676 RepID=UPI00362B0296
MAARASSIGPAGQHVGRAVARAREARSWDQAELVARLAAEGLALSQPILSRVEAGTRRVDVDELLALAVALGVAPVALLPAHSGPEPAAPDPSGPGGLRGVSVVGVVLDEADPVGPVSAALADDIEQLGDLMGMEPTLAATAVRLAELVDGGRHFPCEECGHLVRGPVDAKTLPQLTRELRATVAALVEGRAVDDDDDDGLDDLGAV